MLAAQHASCKPEAAELKGCERAWNSRGACRLVPCYPVSVSLALWHIKPERIVIIVWGTYLILGYLDP